MTGSENERLARLETQVQTLTDTQKETAKKVNEMHEAFLAARGAKWVIITLWIGIGAFLANVKAMLVWMGVRFE